ncbi:hypothetical protein HN681_05090 [archaeon]|jgi:hypothetical protein|nr:hypothetical protein [archaeon]MBT4669693.1 hypothetical protein [archaeon]MBT5030446.1 hypothetical protein [archaeon]MBT5288261.1 hypothetical protein [archaeon]MBT7052899.1 hypothetical protein [archaeon]
MTLQAIVDIIGKPRPNNFYLLKSEVNRGKPISIRKKVIELFPQDDDFIFEVADSLDESIDLFGDEVCSDMRQDGEKYLVGNIFDQCQDPYFVLERKGNYVVITPQDIMIGDFHAFDVLMAYQICMNL